MCTNGVDVGPVNLLVLGGQPALGLPSDFSNFLEKELLCRNFEQFILDWLRIRKVNGHDGLQLLHPQVVHSALLPVIAQGADPLDPVLAALPVVEEGGPAAVERVEIVEHDVELLQHVLQVGHHAGVV